MIAALAVLGILLAAVGAGLVLMSEGTWGLGLGLAAMSVGLALAVATAAGAAAGLVLAAGGLGAVTLRMRGEEGGWGLLPPGTTSRVVLWVACVAAALYVGLSVVGGPGAEACTAVLIGTSLAGARLLGTATRQAALHALAALGLAAGAAGAWGATALPGASSPLLPATAGALVALIAGLVRGSDRARTAGGA